MYSHHESKTASLRGSRVKLAASKPVKDMYGDIPESWQYSRLIDLITIKIGYAFKSSWYTETGIPLVRGANIAPGELDWSNTVYLPEENSQEYEDYLIECDDILLAMDRPLISTGLKVAIANDANLPAFFGSASSSH